MHSIKIARLQARQVDTFLRNDAKTLFFETGIDFSGQVTLGSVRLDDGKRAFHVSIPHIQGDKKLPSYTHISSHTQP